jgi:LPS export ABC transporter protein LptC
VIRRLFFLVPLALVILAAWATLHSLQRVDVAEEPPATTRARYELAGAEWTRFDAQGKALLHATADRIRYYDDKSAELDQLNVDHLGSEPGPWHLTAPRGITPANEQRMQLTEPVTMRGSLRDGEPLELTVDTVWLDLGTHEIYTDSPLTIVAPYRRVDAVGMRSDWAGTFLKLERDVKVVYATRG